MDHSTIVKNHLINVKYILHPTMTCEETTGNSSNSTDDIIQIGGNVENEKIRKIFTHLETSVSPSFISHKSWCLPLNGKYPVQSAVQILKKMQDLGLGSIREISHPHNSKKSKLFVKRRYEDLSNDVRAFLHSHPISHEEFNAPFNSTNSC